jgi:hypothetical protein
LQRLRAERVERPFAHGLETGGMRMTFLRGEDSIYQRLCSHFGVLDLGLAMRKLFGKGTPKGLATLPRALLMVLAALGRLLRPKARSSRPRTAICCLSSDSRRRAWFSLSIGPKAICSTGC